MTAADRVTRWNLWYDSLPEDTRFQYILWPLLALGTVNLWLTLATRFPFALLVLLGVLFIAAVRVPYVQGWVRPAHALAPGGPATHHPRFQVAGPPWLIDLNRWYEGLPESRRLWVYPAVLLAAGAIN